MKDAAKLLELPIWKSIITKQFGQNSDLLTNDICCNAAMILILWQFVSFQTFFHSSLMTKGKLNVDCDDKSCCSNNWPQNGGWEGFYESWLSSNIWFNYERGNGGFDILVHDNDNKIRVEARWWIRVSRDFNNAHTAERTFHFICLSYSISINGKGNNLVILLFTFLH